MKTKYVEIHLPYFEQGDDLRGCLEDTASVADAVLRAARLASWTVPLGNCEPLKTRRERSTRRDRRRHAPHRDVRSASPDGPPRGRGACVGGRVRRRRRE